MSSSTLVGPETAIIDGEAAIPKHKSKYDVADFSWDLC